MAKDLTAIAVENLKPGEKRREVPDGRVGSLYFVVQPSGVRSWAFRYRFAGKPRKLTLGQYPAVDLKTARAKANEAKAKIAERVDPGVEKKTARAAALVADLGLDCIDTIVPRFVEQHARRNLKPSTAREVERTLMKEVVGPWHGRRLSQVTRADIHQLLDNIIARGAPVSANRVLAWLRRLCAWAVERDVLQANPCAGIKRPAVEKARSRVLCDRELAAVWKAADGLGAPYCAFVRLLVLTGQRRNEVAGLTWAEVDLDARIWTLPAARSKNAREHAIPLSDSAIGILGAIPRTGSDFVFAVSDHGSIKGFDLVKRRIDALMPAETQPWVLHDIRRSVASGLAGLGVNLPVIEKLLNHVSGSFAGIVGVYQKYSFADEKRAAMDAWASHVEKLICQMA